ncbi:hypothetical protein KJ853_00160 [Patescibacteria group bacterium]|nr:hypothetical protein [Patescibacteria group bacterium]
MVFEPGTIDNSPKGISLTEEQKIHIEARCGIECLLKKAAKILGQATPSFILLPVSKSNGASEAKKVVFVTVPAEKATLFGLPPIVAGKDPWSVHSQIGSKISTFLETQGRSFLVKK